MKAIAIAALLLISACAPCGKTLDPRPMPTPVAPTPTPAPSPTPDPKDEEIDRLKADVEYYREKYYSFSCD